MTASYLGPLMFLGLLVFLFSGYPVAFSLAGVGLLFSIIGMAVGVFEPALFYALPERMFGIMANTILLAVPFFIFMGTMLEKTKIAEELLTGIGKLFGPLRGGLAVAVVLVGTLLAAATGVVGASVVAMGMISLPVMLRYGYSKELATGVIIASGTLGQIIPPSVVLVILGDQMGVSVGELFVGALVPGLIVAGLFLVYVIVIAMVKPELAPALPAEERPANLKALLADVALALLPPLFLILLVLGSIFAGVATPTEAGALGAMGALTLAAVRRKLTKKALFDTMEGTAKLTIMVVFLLIGSTVFALVFRGVGGDIWIDDWLLNIPGGKWGLLTVSMLVIFVLGFFIDFFEIVFIVVPILAPAAVRLGIDPVWFGVLIGMNLQTSFLSPPFGFSIFYLKGIAPPEIRTEHIYRGVVPFIALQLIALFILLAFPEFMGHAE
ncbi:TRAP transporter large permease [Leptonema illini]|uniref:TRAP dicarboxylate transporter, DctM subunit n=1 Tax=Leptonema illini DSM 21528 TaxID=929563 RepID=H2CGS6_9LEPT|nr:TRAP transporter large permease subunit [Leptonema illini]EHQ04752.1 TRAP dicarboxylate transporter, DctM subunit [Leptonema illini DSM 21528]